MKNFLTVPALLLLLSGTALAGSEYDRCSKEEKALKAQEAGQCSGLRYIFNPSACFATQKALKGYPAGACRQIGLAENADSSVQKVIPEKKAISAGSFDQKKVETEVPRQESTIEQLKEENTRLKAENIRLKAENDKLKNAGQ